MRNIKQSTNAWIIFREGSDRKDIRWTFPARTTDFWAEINAIFADDVIVDMIGVMDSKRLRWIA